tara:strand:+ start:45202 stop:45501 length:300 start_codon:yes stop_codon:yes gene_type:complete
MSGYPNPVLGFSIEKTRRYKKDCIKYKNILNRILNTELKIINYPNRSRVLHGPLGNNCKGFLHAYIDENSRILYKPYYKKKIVFLKFILTHREMEKKCD